MPNTPDTERLLTYAEVADHLGVTVRTVQRYVAAGHLHPIRVGWPVARAVRFNADDLPQKDAA